MELELDRAINATANMRDTEGNWIRVGTFTYDNRPYGFIKQREKITVRCIELSPDGKHSNMYPNLNVEWEYDDEDNPYWTSEKINIKRIF